MTFHINFEKIRDDLRKTLNHENEWDKYVTILEEVGTGYFILEWEYGNHKVSARSTDYYLLGSIRKVIEMYLEEKERQPKSHELIRYNVTYEEEETGK